mgnify:FL=1
MKNICIIDYGLGNLASIYNAVRDLETSVCVTSEIKKIENCSHLILPGVGSYYEGVKGLQKRNLIESLNIEVLKKQKPFLGICLGMQLLSTNSDEGEKIDGLNWIEGKVIKINNSKGVKIPHMGWNNVKFKDDSVLFKKIKNEQSFYFVHSYHFIPKNKDLISSSCDHGNKIVSSVEKENIFATQFHPEKSHDDGMQIIRNFIKFKC